MPVALSMEGGAMRGMFTCGVFDVFLENGIRFQAAAGISAGACFGCNFKSGQIGRPIRYNKTYCHDRRYGTLWSVLHSGDLYDADFCYRELPDVLDPFDRRAYRDNPMPFYIGATDVRTGKAVYRACNTGDDLDLLWMRASASMPIVSRPVAAGDLLLLDGGISDPVPYSYMKSIGYAHQVVILTQPRGYVKKEMPMRLLMKWLLRSVPRVAEAMAVRHIVYNDAIREIMQAEARGDVLVIAPPAPLGLSRTEKNAEKLEMAYQTGRKAALECLSAVRSFCDAHAGPLSPSGEGSLLP